MKEWKIKSSNMVLDTKWMKIKKDVCELPDGMIISDYYVWQGGDFSMIFALRDDNKVALVKQYKHGAGEIVIELPAGMVDSREDSANAAARELEEEIGYKSNNYTFLSSTFTSSAKSSGRGHFYLAENLKCVGEQKLDETEDIIVLWKSIPELINMIISGKIKDVNSIAATFLALQKLE